MPDAHEKKPVAQISSEDVQKLLGIYDENKDGKLSKNEISEIVRDYNDKKITDKRVLEILQKYDTNKDGSIDEHEVQHFEHQLSLTESTARYAGYSAVFARAFRYLAFTSDFGEAFRPVASARIVNFSYAIAFGYCITDVGWEAYKLKQRGYKTEKGHPMSLAQCITERATFQAVASMAVPTLIIHTSVSTAKKVFTKMGRFTKWGPSVVGLSIIPLLPLYLDEPVEHFIEHAFEKYGPWATATKKLHKE